MLKPRQKKFLDNLNKNDFNIKKSAIEAGYSESYADKQGKIILNTAVKAQAHAIAESLEGKILTKDEARQTMAELVGMSREDVMERLRTIALQDKDLNSALKVLKPLAKEYSVDLGDEEAQKVVVPVLNIGVRPLNPPIIGNNTAINKDIIE